MSIREWFKSNPYWIKGLIIGLIIILIYLFFNLNSGLTRMNEIRESYPGSNPNINSFILSSFLNTIITGIPLILVLIIGGVIVEGIKNHNSFKGWYNSLSYYKKGGLIGWATIFFGGWIWLTILGIIEGHYSCSMIVDSTFCSFFQFIIHPLHWIAMLIYSIPGFIIGAMVGFIIGKIKSKKSE